MTAMDEGLSRGMGKAKAAKARMHGLTGIFKRLCREHGEAQSLINRIAVGSDAHIRAELFSKLRAQLLAHEQGELSELYPILRQHEVTRSSAERHGHEAEEMDALLDRLHTQAVDAPGWREAFDRLVQVVGSHARYEEEEVFPEAQALLGEDIAEELGKRYATANHALMHHI